MISIQLKTLMYCVLLVTAIFFVTKIGYGQQIIPGAHRLDAYLNLLKGKKIGLVVNQTSTIGQTHLVDTLLRCGINIKSIFAPEHGFRGDADAGAYVAHGKDSKTGISLISLYGKTKKPTEHMLKDIDLLVYDMQDVGARFYTYLSTLHYVLEASQEQNIPLVLLDRPNPNGMYIDGPILDTTYKSFVGLHPIPVLHGCTLGEMAQMILGERWINTKTTQLLTVIPCMHYSHSKTYEPPVKPSPNLPNSQSIRLYASLCLFEGTNISVGRGTYMPFQIYGHTFSGMGNFVFTPVSIAGMSTDPPFKNMTVYGVDLRSATNVGGFTLRYLLDAYQKTPEAEKIYFFNPFFTKLIGNTWVKEMVKAQKTEQEIREKWAEDLMIYKKIRQKYLMYP